jgi:hypothetical protein
MLALKTMFDPAAADGLDARYELRLGEHRYRAAVSAGRLELARGTADDPDATIETDPATLAAVVWHGSPVADLQIAGSRAAARRFLKLFAA